MCSYFTNCTPFNYCCLSVSQYANQSYALHISHNASWWGPISRTQYFKTHFILCMGLHIGPQLRCIVEYVQMVYCIDILYSEVSNLSPLVTLLCEYFKVSTASVDTTKETEKPPSEKEGILSVQCPFTVLNTKESQCVAILCI